jgi:hypothetical protein
MSYCRFIEADAYIYDDVRFGLYCMGCSLMPLKTEYSVFFEEDMTFHESFTAGYDYDKMLAHVAEHRVAGDYVPEDVDERLIFERDCKHDYNSEGICKHCWGREDNDKR